MPKFLDAHTMEIEEKSLRQLVDAPRNDLGVKFINVFYNKADKKAHCMIDAPSRDAVLKFHGMMGLVCEWLMEVEGARLIE